MILGVISLVLTSFITSFQFGFFTLSSFALLMVLIVFVFGLVFRTYKQGESPHSQKKQVANFFPLVLFFSYFLFLYFSRGLYQTDLYFSTLIMVLPLLGLPFLLLYAFSDFAAKYFPTRLQFFVLIIIAFLLRVCMILSSPEPVIDVFFAQKEAVLHFLAGDNPYDSIYTNVYSIKEGTVFAYLPAVFLLQIPFVSLFSDPRVIMSISDVIAAFLLFKIAGKSPTAEVLALIYLYRTNSLFVIEQAWLAPLILLFVILLFYISQFKRTYFFLKGSVCAVLALIQFHYLVFFIFLLLLYRKQRNFLLGFVIVFFSIIVPFFLWNPRAFYERTFLLYMRGPEILANVMPIHKSLSVNTFYYMLTGQDYPSFVIYVVIALSFLFLFYFCHLYILRVKNEFDKNAFLLLCCISFFLIFFSFSFFSFINYYYYIGGLIILWLCIKVRRYA